jgi:hypothetical protein
MKTVILPVRNATIAKTRMLTLNSRHLLRAPLWQRPRSSHHLQQQFRPSMSMVQTLSSQAETASLLLVLSKRGHDATLNAHR